MARPKLGDGDTQRLQLKITEEEVKAIDDFRFAHRVQSRSEAVRRLCQMGLEIDEFGAEISKSYKRSAKASRKALDIISKALKSEGTSVETKTAYMTAFALIDANASLLQVVNRILTTRDLAGADVENMKQVLINIAVFREMFDEGV